MGDPLKIKTDQYFGTVGGFIWGLGTGNILDQTDLIAYIASHSGGVTTANDGLSMNGSTAILGGVTLQDKVIDMSINENQLWIKTKVNNDGSRGVIIGSLNTDSGWNAHGGLLISKSKNDDFDRCNLLTLTTGDAGGGGMNGFFFINYQDVVGECLPNLRVASNAPNGSSAAFNLDLAGRDSHSDFSHFSVFYYDYDQYVLHGNQAVGMANSALVNFTNGTGGALSGSTVHFWWVDKNYNWMIGKNGWNDRPVGALQIGDGAQTYAIYQKGATSTNWFAGKVHIGGSAIPSTHPLEIANSNSSTNPFIQFQDGSNTLITNVRAFKPGGSDTTFIISDTGGASITGRGNFVWGSGAAFNATTTRDSIYIGAKAGWSVTTGEKNIIIGSDSFDTGVVGNVGIVNLVMGTNNYDDGAGASIGNANVILGGFNNNNAANGILGSNNIIIGVGNFLSAASPASTDRTIIIGNGIFTSLSNIICLGDTQHVIIGGTVSPVDTGDQLQVYGTMFLSSLPSSVNTKTSVAWDTVNNKLVSLGFTPYNAANPSGYISSITSGMIITALGFTPVTNARLISTTSPIIGGGNLSADRTIAWDFAIANTWTANQTYNLGAIAGTITPVISLRNTTAATVGVQQIPGAILWEGQGWKTNATAASQSVVIRNYMAPAQSSITPLPQLIWDYNINNTGAATWFYFTQNTTVIPTGGVSFNTGASMGFEIIANNIISFRNTAGEHIRCNTSNVTALMQALTTCAGALTVATTFGVTGASTFTGIATQGGNNNFVFKAAVDATFNAGLSFQATTGTERAFFRTNLVSGAVNLGTTNGGYWLALFGNNAEVARVGSDGVGFAIKIAGNATAHLHLGAGTIAASTAPMKINSGPVMTAAETGALEYDGTNLFFTRVGTTRENILTTPLVSSITPTVQNRTIKVNINGTDYYITAKTTND